MTEMARTAAAELELPGADGQPVLDRLVALLDLERIEENIFRGVSPPTPRCGCSAARSPARRWWRPVGPCRRSAGCTPCTPTSSAPATRASRSCTRWTASGTAARSPPAGWSRSSAARRSSRCRRRSSWTSRAWSTASRCRSVPDPESLPTLTERAAGLRDRRAQPAAADRPALRHRPAVGHPRDRPARRPQPGVDARRRQAARRPAAARLRAGLRLGHDAAGLGAGPARRVLGHGQGARREPGPRDVVPPARSAPTSGSSTTASRRRASNARGLATGRFFAATARSSPPSSRKDFCASSERWSGNHPYGRQIVGVFIRQWGIGAGKRAGTDRGTAPDPFSE